MQILVNNIYCTVLDASSQEKSILHKALSIEVPSARFSPHFQRGQWDGTKKFFHLGLNRFLTGLLPFVLSIAHEHRLSVSLKDERATRPLNPLWELQAYPLLREYQKFHLGAILKLLEGDSAAVPVPWGRGIIKHPTGAGKTYFAAALLLAIHRRSLFVVGRRDLLYQTQQVFADQLKRGIGIIGDDQFDLRAVTVSTVQTLVSRLHQPVVADYLSNVDVLMFDECHHVNKGQYETISVRCPAYFRFGFSASPLSRGDVGDVMLIGHTGEIISEIQRKDLEDTGFLAKAQVKLITISDPQIVGWAPYAEVYDKGIVHQRERNELVVLNAVQACKRRKETVLILVRKIEHGQALYDACARAGVPTEYLHGASGMAARRAALARMRKRHAGRPFVVVASTIFDEGIDAPDIRCLILAGGGASRIKSVQRVGRGLRPKAGENVLTVIDFLDETHRYLLKHSRQRIASYTQEGFTMTYE